jgi:hypothetical protein
LEDARECLPILEGVPHKKMVVPDEGFDIGSYVRAAQAFSYRFFAFFNSFSRILCEGWLSCMLRHASKPGVGLVGATGSHQSPLTDLDDLQQRHVELNLVFYKYWYVSIPRVRQRLLHVWGRFPPYPNPHLRTNAFMVGRDFLLRLKGLDIRQKWDAYRFESGKASLTRQALSAGAAVLVVGRDGAAYEPKDWSAAKTFWMSDQENLLASDNQTRAYSDGDRVAREFLAFSAWRRWPDGSPRTDLPAMPR